MREPDIDSAMRRCSISRRACRRQQPARACPSCATPPAAWLPSLPTATQSLSACWPSRPSLVLCSADASRGRISERASAALNKVFRQSRRYVTREVCSPWKPWHGQRDCWAPNGPWRTAWRFQEILRAERTLSVLIKSHQLACHSRECHRAFYKDTQGGDRIKHCTYNDSLLLVACSLEAR